MPSVVVFPPGTPSTPTPITGPYGLSIGTVSTLSPGANATADITGAFGNQIMDLGIPRGADGYVGSYGLSIGTVSTLSPGANATADITGAVGNQILDLGIPRGANGYVGSSASKTAAYTIAVGDNQSIISLGGSAFYAVTFPTPAGFSPGFYVNLVNTDTRAKSIVLSGGGSYLLWPGQSDQIYNTGTAWAPINGPNRYRLTATTIFYIDNTNGNDSNDGLATGTGAFKTGTGAWNALVQNIDVNNQFVAFFLAAGQTWTAPQDFTFYSPWVGGGQVIFDGNGSANIHPTSGHAVNLAATMGLVTFRNMRLDANANSSCLVCSSPNTLNTGTGMIWGAAGASHVQASGTGSVISLNGNSTISGSAAQHYSAVQGGFIVELNNTVTVNANVTFTYFAYADRASNLQVSYGGATVYSLGAYTVTGTRYIATTNSIITGTGAAANFFPGTIAGSVATGGVYQ